MKQYRIIPGDYYKLLKQTPEEPKFVCVHSVELDTVHFVDIMTGNRYHNTLDGFSDLYEADDKGLENHTKRIQTIFSDISAIQQRNEQMVKQLGNIEEQSMALVQRSSVPANTKEQLIDIKKNLQRSSVEIISKQEEMQVILQERMNALTARIEQINEVVERVSEVVWVVDLYLGTNETIKQIASGKACGIEEKVVIRQLALYMDEECIIAADKQGIDFKDLETFDQWVVKPHNLQQVLPEPKGIIVLKPCRNNKDYGNPWQNAQCNALNKQTYFLIRNGENLYRICTSLQVGETVFPKQKEFDDEFMCRVYYGDEDYKPIRPGDHEYIKAMKRCDEKRRHYLSILMFLQGIFDRTKILHPIEGNRVNLGSKREYDHVLRFVHDAENVLSDGKPRFYDWLRSINEKLMKGMRIMGSFHYSSWKEIQEDNRVRPRTASKPDDLVLYTIEGEIEKKLVIYYERGDTIWGYRESHEAKKRASLLLYKSDNFILNFDSASIEDMEYYLSCRLDRPGYLTMVPLLQKAVELKKKEVEEEEPFKKLLIGMIMNKYKADIKLVETELPKLVDWWKFKNRTHRALTSDDTLAIKMIIEQFGLQQRYNKDWAKLKNQDEEIVKSLLSLSPKAVYIGHKKGNDYVVLEAANEENYFVHEQLWHFGRTSKMTKERSWTVPDNRAKTWRQMWVHERWNNWPKDLRKELLLTDSERNSVLEEALIKCRNFYTKGDGVTDRFGNELRFLPVYAGINNKEHELCIYFNECKVQLSEHLLSEYIKAPSVNAIEVKYKKCKGIISVYPQFYNGSHTYSYRWTGEEDTPFRTDKRYVVPWLNPKITIFWKNEDNLKQLLKETKEYDEQNAKKEKLSKIVDNYLKVIMNEIISIYTEFEYKKFCQENAPEMWERVQKEKVEKSQPIHEYDVNRVLSIFIEDGVEIEGRTFKELCTIYKERSDEEFKKDAKENKDNVFWHGKKWDNPLEVIDKELVEKIGSIRIKKEEVE